MIREGIEYVSKHAQFFLFLGVSYLLRTWAAFKLTGLWTKGYTER